MEAFPGRFPNEIVHELDIGLYGRVLRAQQMLAVERKRKRWLAGEAVELTPDDWELIREIDELMDDATVRERNDG